MSDAFIVDACRTPRGIGKQGKGALAHHHPQDLGATVLRAIRDLGLDRTKVNINGGSIALGHPIGAPGAGTALDEWERSGARYALITMCAFGGMAPAIILERLN